ncbi:hypothetical protein [Paenibacillus sp. XY044]|uniref:hypothetical protein n=1 Tax=Paenibacillus sp. XY044 TaxID=2026089 RepID=UPI000B996AD1|nr:hypothetical protein [Paenibacillus sp. XY044]OZB92353.1 hypothetical protein CJP46_25860 [Paenibacillus sp. XY044]
MNKNIKELISHKKIIGVGARRVVYVLGNNFVLKVAKSKYGIKSNKKEVMLYKLSPSKIKKHLARVQQYGDGYDWLVMKRYCSNFKKNNTNMRRLFAMKAKFRYYGVLPFEVTTNNGKPNYENIRLKSNNEIVVIDYGNFKW